MDTSMGLLLMITAAAVGIVATIQILRRDRLRLSAVDHESQFAVATEGMERCPTCGMGNLVGDRTCSACGKTLPQSR